MGHFCAQSQYFWIFLYISVSDFSELAPDDRQWRVIKSDIGIFEENSYHAQNGEMRPFRAQNQQFLTFL